MRIKTYPKEILWKFLEPLGGVRRPRFDKSRCSFQYGLPALKLGIEIVSGNIGSLKFPKYNRAVLAGWVYLRFTESEVRKGIAAEMIEKFIGRGR